MSIRKILVVDDSPTERLALQEVLARNGYEIITAESGEEAIQRSKADKPDLILMDVVMPGMNGYQATRTISRDDATRNIPIIMCTTKGEETDKIWGMRQGAYAYLVKPLDHNDLLARIRAIGCGDHGPTPQPARIPGRSRPPAGGGPQHRPARPARFPGR